MNKPNCIILHCSATKEGQNYSVADIDRWHKARGWKGVGYHHVIDLYGNPQIGRDESEMGAHCLGKNNSSIGICYIGGLDSNGKPKDTRTAAQKEALYKLCYFLCNKYGFDETRIFGHNEFANKACPSFSSKTFREELKQWMKERNLEFHR